MGVTWIEAAETILGADTTGDGVRSEINEHLVGLLLSRRLGVVINEMRNWMAGNLGGLAGEMMLREDAFDVVCEVVGPEGIGNTLRTYLKVLERQNPDKYEAMVDISISEERLSFVVERELIEREVIDERGDLVEIVSEDLVRDAMFVVDDLWHESVDVWELSDEVVRRMVQSEKYTEIGFSDEIWGSLGGLVRSEVRWKVFE